MDDIQKLLTLYGYVEGNMNVEKEYEQIIDLLVDFNKSLLKIKETKICKLV